MCIAGVPLKFECENCEQLFDYEAHLEHVCEYDSNGERIVGEHEQFDAFESSKTTKLMNDNVVQLKRLISDISGESVVSKGNKSHVCKICLRSYVHGTGLARHMKTHNVQQVEKQPKRPSATAAACKPIDDVKVVCECLFCGRIFSSVTGALGHYEHVHGFGDDPVAQPTSETNESPDLSISDQVSINVLII